MENTLLQEAPIAPNPNACRRCCGQGKYPIDILWSDGWGTTETSCEACNGTGVLSVGDAIDRMVEAERELKKSQKELARLRRCAALFLHFEEHGDGAIIDPPFEDAPRPAPFAACWRDELQKAGELAPGGPLRGQALGWANCEARRLTVGKRVEVVKGRKVPIGTIGVVTAYYPEPYGKVILVADGEELTTYEQNVKVLVEVAR